jgi:predicted ATP-grasp superfamily ATP-dependent carboligase
MGNTEQEEAYVQAVLGICQREKVDIIFPSWDPQVYVFSKNKQRFESMGVLLPIPDYDTLIIALDKYRTIQAAEQVGFPCPRTYIPTSEQDLRKVAEVLGFPLVIKLRFTSGGRGQEIVKSLEELLRKALPLVESDQKPMVQEYVPGRRQAVHVVLDRTGQLRMAFTKMRLRNFRVGSHMGTVSESIAPTPQVPAVAALLRSVGWWGCAGAEMIFDTRDGVPKLMEINPRFPRQLWNRTELGINEPLMCVNIARSEEFQTPVAYPAGVLFVSPIEDLLLFTLQVADLLSYKVRIGLLGKTPLYSSNPPTSLKDLVRSLRYAYLSGKRIIPDPYFKHFLQDPLTATLWWFQFVTWIIGTTKKLGK